MKATKPQIKAYKTSIHKTWLRCKELGLSMTKKQIDEEVKINAGFPYKSTTDERATTEDLINLTIWADIYGDQYGLNNNFPEDELDKQIKLNWNRNE